MAFRFCFIPLIVVSVLVSGCRAPDGHDTKASADGSIKPRIAASQFSASGEIQDPELVLGALGDKSSSNNAIEDALIDAHAHYAAGIIHEMNIEVEPALNEYYNAATLDPTNEALVLDVAQQFLQAKQPEKALELLTRSTAYPNASGALFAQLGFVYSKLGRTNDAVKADRIAIQKDPRLLAGYQSLFLDYAQNKRIPEILGLLDEAAKVKGTDAEFLIGLAELNFRFGAQFPDQKTNANIRALAALQRMEKMKISDLQLRLRLADGFNLLGQSDKASKIYEGLVKELPDVSILRDTVRSKLADVYLRSDDYKRAAEQLEVIIRNNPADAQAYYVLGSIADEEKRYAQAVDCFSKTLLFRPDYEPAYYALASSQLSAERGDDALATIERARQKFPANFLSEYLSAMVYTHQKNYSNAVAHFTAAELLAQTGDPRRLTDGFYFQMGAAYERNSDYAQAEKYFEKCLQLSPNFIEALNYLGYMWAERGEKLDRARQFIEKALKAEPKSAAYLDSMAWVLFKQNQPKPALDYALKAIQFSEEEDATVYDHLGDIYAALGQQEKAREAWRKSLSLEANDIVQKKLGADSK